MTKFSERKKFVTFMREHTGILIVSVIFLIAGLLSLNEILVYTPDSARYLAWAKSLANFEGFQDLTTPLPVKYVVHAPLYSILLAPVAAIFPYSVPAAKMATNLLGIAVLVAIYWWVRKNFGTAWGVASSLLLALNPAMILYSTQVLSDVPFALTVILFFILAQNSLEGEAHPARLSAALIAVVVCGIFLRDVGLTLVLVGTLFFLIAKRPKQALLLISVSMVLYLLWYVRNEVIVASIEQPPMRNTQVFLKHMFTPTNASLFDEFLARLTSNSAIYAIALARIPFLTEMVVRNISVYSPAQFPMSLILKFMPLLYYPFLVVTFVSMTAGIIREFRHRQRFLLLTLFLACYSIPILLYPINDTRFLLPILILLLYWFVAGAKWIHDILISQRVPTRIVFAGEVICLTVLMAPNLAWTATYVSNNFRYEQASLDFFNRMSTLPFTPELFSRPLDLAGKWLAQNAGSSEVVVCRWKELAMWTDGRLVLDADPQTTLDEYEGLLRDYRVQYIVTVLSRGGLREYESQFARSVKFDFVTVQRIANIEVIRVYPKKEGNASEQAKSDSADFAGRSLFDKALRLIQLDRPVEAETLLTNLPDQFRTQVPILLNIAIAREFEGHLVEAERILERFRLIQQAGSAVQQAWYHQELIARIRDAARIPTGTAKAEMFHRVALDYWQLGYRRQCMRFLDSSIVQDGTFFPALIFKAICAAQLGDTTTLRKALDKARAFDPMNVLVKGLESIKDERSQLARSNDPHEVIAVRIAMAGQLRAIGLREEAIDELLASLKRNPDNVQVLRMLVAIYEEKGRYAPAVFYLKRLVELHPEDVTLREEMTGLKSRW